MIFASAAPMEIGESFRIRDNGTSTFYKVEKKVEVPPSSNGTDIFTGRVTRTSRFTIPVVDGLAKIYLYEAVPED